MYSSLLIANYFINKGFLEGIEHTPMKIIKTVYVAHGWYLGNIEEPLITEAVQAWQYGPVVPNVYYAFRKYGKRSILELYNPNEYNISDGNLNKEITSFLDAVWGVYKNVDGIRLGALTHKKDTPWDIINAKYGWEENPIIPNSIIMNYYKDKVAQIKSKSV